MSIIAIDIGTTATKIIEYGNKRIINKETNTNGNAEQLLIKFINQYKIKDIEQLVITGIGADKVKLKNFNIPIKIVDEFKAIAKGGLYLSKKENALIVSIGTGTAFIKANKNEYQHLGGTRNWRRNYNKSL